MAAGARRRAARHADQEADGVLGTGDEEKDWRLTVVLDHLMVHICLREP
jgi:hypothetical protein